MIARIALLVLGSQLIAASAFAAAEKVPNLDVAGACNAAARADTSNQRQSAEACLRDENEARGTLEQQWTDFASEDRSDCSRTANIGSASYVQLLTCLEMRRDVKKIPKQDRLIPGVKSQ